MCRVLLYQLHISPEFPILLVTLHVQKFMTSARDSDVLLRESRGASQKFNVATLITLIRNY